MIRLYYGESYMSLRAVFYKIDISVDKVIVGIIMHCSWLNYQMCFCSKR